ncbi:MAG: Fur family transcriptional regulator [Anaerolineales bacterium]
MKSVERTIERFHRDRLRVTPQRRVIFELLVDDETHPTADEIYQRVLNQLPDVSCTTVYNTLHELVALGELSPVEGLGDDGTRYDTNTDDHHHLYCLRCHAVVDVDRSFEGLELEAAERAGYQTVRKRVTFYGYCPECQDA